MGSDPRGSRAGEVPAHSCSLGLCGGHECPGSGIALCRLEPDRVEHGTGHALAGVSLRDGRVFAASLAAVCAVLRSGESLVLCAECPSVPGACGCSSSGSVGGIRAHHFTPGQWRYPPAVWHAGPRLASQGFERTAGRVGRADPDELRANLPGGRGSDALAHQVRGAGIGPAVFGSNLYEQPGDSLFIVQPGAGIVQCRSAPARVRPDDGRGSAVGHVQRGHLSLADRHLSLTHGLRRGPLSCPGGCDGQLRHLAGRGPGFSAGGLRDSAVARGPGLRVCFRPPAVDRQAIRQPSF